MSGEIGCLVGAIIPVALIGFGVLMKKVGEDSRTAAMTPEELAEDKIASVYGPENPAMVCPHCQTKGHIRTKPIDKPAGISGGKAVGAVMTGGASLLVTGIGRTDQVTQAHCSECSNTWTF